MPSARHQRDLIQDHVGGIVVTGHARVRLFTMTNVLASRYVLIRAPVHRDCRITRSRFNEEVTLLESR